jgi:hypothetical protein
MLIKSIHQDRSIIIILEIVKLNETRKKLAGTKEKDNIMRLQINLRKQTFTRIRQVTIRRSLHYDLKK